MTLPPKAVRKLDVHQWAREHDEHYVEPQWVSRRLFEVESFVSEIWDPACGFGRIPEAARAAHHCCRATDVVDGGYTHFHGVENFLTATRRVGNIISNPPFDRFQQFAIQALRLSYHKVALICLVRRLNAAGRWLEQTPLARILLLTPRPSMPPGHVIANGEKPGGGSQDFCWLVWDRAHSGAPSMAGFTEMTQRASPRRGEGEQPRLFDCEQKRKTQMTKIVPVHEPVPVVSDEVSPWRACANEDAGTFLAGDLLKFVKGEWLLGESKAVVGPATPFVVNMREIWRGYVRWWDHQATDHVIGRLVDRFVIPPRSTLGDLDKSRWEAPDKDPWQPTRYVVMRNLDSGQLCTFATSSDGGIKAVGKLCDQFDSLRNRYPGCMPVFLLEKGGYEHKDRSFGWVDTPIFKIVDWSAWDENAPADKPTQPLARRIETFGEPPPVELDDEFLRDFR